MALLDGTSYRRKPVGGSGGSKGCGGDGGSDGDGGGSNGGGDGGVNGRGGDGDGGGGEGGGEAAAGDVNSSTRKPAALTPSTVNCVVSACSSDGASLKIPCANALAFESASSWVATKISAVTTTEPGTMWRATALVETPASAASMVFIDAFSASP